MARVLAHGGWSAGDRPRLIRPISVAVEIIAHRGASHDAPENTLAAFQLGFLQGADGVELDIHLTRDGKIAVLHDSDTWRVSGTAKRVREHAFRELRELDVGAWGQWAGGGFSESIPELGEVLALVPEARSVFIELKCGEEILPELGRTLDGSGLNGRQIVLIGFGYETMRAARAMFPDFQILWLVAADRQTGEYPGLSELIERAQDAGFDGLDLEKGFPIDWAFAQGVREADLKLYTWTVDDAGIAREQMEAGVDGVTTNRPAWLREALGLI